MKKIMEPKVIKEEGTEKESPNYLDTLPAAPRSRSAKGCTKDRCKTPDSPEGARINQPVSPSQSSPSRQPTNGGSSPINNGSTDSITPPLGSAALTVSLDANQPHQYSGHGGAATCITRSLLKVKRFLNTLVQFGSEINSDVGERVRSLVLNLVSANLSVEEFHHSLQEVTNFPLRPFVLPFLRAHLPLLQREIHALARANKQSSLQYVRTHEHVVLDSTHSPTEPSEIFLPNDTQLTSGIKRRSSDSIYENGLNGQSHQDSQDFLPAKRQLTSQNAFMFAHQSLFLPNMNSSVSNSHVFDYTQHGHLYTNQHRADDILNNDSRNSNRGDEEWKNIHVMLNCILSMVEKTKRALSILQQRNNQEITNEWLRKQDVGADLKKAANEIMIQAVRQTEDRVAEVRRRAEEAVNDVKRQAVVELQKAVAAAETKATELVASERAKMEKLLLETRKQTDENQTTEPVENSTSPPQTTPSATSQQSSCWNCGRKAHETCSGCNVARYCGPFCQHKDWETHHQACSKEKNRPIRSATPSTTAHINSVDQVKFKK
ncbi:hypothetical protein PPYR_01736 [Photinus pyralis]|uniref:MYND-type domain-containing protein n=2 Tax=Photinus pyralis TaxID=7054 RepID=A0A5N4B5D3_PHOPY|nr:protein CBFA2T1 [Photinus pyralis]KAB0804766.1 hypothetical protein PPYR_01736 [Photinus pyralis]